VKSMLPWVFVDIDSTLVPPGGTVSLRNRTAIGHYRGAAGRCSLATGKHPLALLPLALELGLPGPHIAGNGTTIVTGGACELLADIASEAPALQAALTAHTVAHVGYTADGIFVDDGQVTTAHVEELMGFGEPRPVHGPWPRTVFKILTFVDWRDESTEAALRALADDASVTCLRTGEHFLEFIPATAGKGAAAEAIMARADWPVGASAAIGDSENDVSMMRRCGRAVAVANATEAVLAAAAEIVPSCTDDGVAVYLERLLSACAPA
jgi:Cof subfamily protein (haloacid dehalogenase superfamily)